MGIKKGTYKFKKFLKIELNLSLKENLILMIENA